MGFSQDEWTLAKQGVYTSYILLFSVVLLSACSHMVTSNEYMALKAPGFKPPAPAKALIIFQRVMTSMADCFSATVWDITEQKSY